MLTLRIPGFTLSTMITAVLLVTCLSSAALAGKGDKGGGSGGNDGEPTPPPPVTYLVSWVDDFRLQITNGDEQPVNESLDMIGKTSAGYEVLYSGKLFPLALYFADLDESVRWAYSLSDRQTDGSLYLCGTCDAANGIRGWRMKLSPNASGDLVRTDFIVVEALPGDTISTLDNVNSSGEAVGFSQSATGAQTAIYVTATGDVLPIVFPASGTHFIDNTGVWTSLMELDPGDPAVYQWSPSLGLERVLSASKLTEVNEVGNTIGEITVTESTRNGVIETRFSYFFDGSLQLLGEADAPSISAMNDLDDLLLSERIPANKPRAADQFVRSIYFSDLDKAFVLSDLIDPVANTVEATTRWEAAANDSSTSLIDVLNSGVIVGSSRVGGDVATFILTPIAQ